MRGGGGSLLGRNVLRARKKKKEEGDAGCGSMTTTKGSRGWVVLGSARRGVMMKVNWIPERARDGLESLPSRYHPHS